MATTAGIPVNTPAGDSPAPPAGTGGTGGTNGTKGGKGTTASEDAGTTNVGLLLRNTILGSQDGLVNVLGLVLGVASATPVTHTILVAGLAATFAESISMGAVAYTSTKAESDYYKGMLARERRQIEEIPDRAREDIRVIYARKGFTGDELESIVNTITADTRLWLDTMMLEELRLAPEEHLSPMQQGIFVGIASVIGSLIPVIPFIFLPPVTGAVVATVISIAVLFGIGVTKAKVTGHGGWRKNGLEMAIIGTAAGLAGYLIGLLMQAPAGS